MKEETVLVKNRAGIHARPAALLVQTASKFSSSVFLERNNERVNGKSIMGVITLGAVYNSEIKVIVEGDDEDKALQAIVALFEKKFEED
ncbi:MAG: HPr family phosphocarrier protein [Spirochaetales bacterium]|nr:HPr family phosphocarrier protein [Spirochaetales bacterium]